MATAETARFILQTYELPQKLEERLAWIASERLTELSIDSFSGQYTYIAELVDKFTRRSPERFHKSLDGEISYSDERTLHEVTADSYPDSGTYDHSEDTTTKTRIYEALDTLKEYVSRPQYRFLARLATVTRHDIRAGTFRGEEDIPEVESRLDEIAGRYRLNGKIVVPSRPIKKVTFNPFQIEFHRRRYDGGPLKFFKRNRNISPAIRPLTAGQAMSIVQMILGILLGVYLMRSRNFSIPPVVLERGLKRFELRINRPPKSIRF